MMHFKLDILGERFRVHGGSATIVFDNAAESFGVCGLSPEDLDRLASDARKAANEARSQLGLPAVAYDVAPPLPLTLTCPVCNARHVDRGEFETKPHHTHSCQSCGLTWRPAVAYTVGVQFLPGFKDETPAVDENDACRGGASYEDLSDHIRDCHEAIGPQKHPGDTLLGRVKAVVAELAEARAEYTCAFENLARRFEARRDGYMRSHKEAIERAASAGDDAARREAAAQSRYHAAYAQAYDEAAAMALDVSKGGKSESQAGDALREERRAREAAEAKVGRLSDHLAGAEHSLRLVDEALGEALPSPSGYDDEQKNYDDLVRELAAERDEHRRRAAEMRHVLGAVEFNRGGLPGEVAEVVRAALTGEPMPESFTALYGPAPRDGEAGACATFAAPTRPATAGPLADLGEAVRDARVRLGLSVRDVAGAFPVSPTRWGEFERGVIATRADGVRVRTSKRSEGE